MVRVAQQLLNLSHRVRVRGSVYSTFELMRANWQEARTFSANREQRSKSLIIGVRDLVNKHSYPINSYRLLRNVPNTYPSQALCRLYPLSVNAFVHMKAEDQGRVLPSYQERSEKLGQILWKKRGRQEGNSLDPLVNRIQPGKEEDEVWELRIGPIGPLPGYEFAFRKKWTIWTKEE